MAFDFADLVDLKRVKALMQLFYELTGFPSTLIDPDGRILQTQDGEMLGVGWKKVCLDFHRMHPETLKGCIESDVELSRSANCVGDGRATCYTCRNGLVDAAAPVVVGGRHLVNLFTGQFFNQPPDEDWFRERARQFGFDEEAYIEALKEIRTFTPEFVTKGLAFFDLLAGLLGELGLKQQELAELNRALEARNRELKVAREQAEAASRAKSSFLAMVSHELRSPLQNFELQLTLLRRALDTGAADKARAALDRLEATSGRMGGIVGAVLNQCMLESGKLQVQPAAVDLDALAAEVAAELGPRAAAKGLALAALPAADGPLPPLRTDPELVRLILANLVDNAVKYTREGSITVSTAFAGGLHRIVVADTGIGIAAADRQVIFDPFRQLESVEHKHTPGVGLGLALVADVVARLGGRIELESEPGRGSVFTVLLPPLAAEAAA